MLAAKRRHLQYLLIVRCDRTVPEVPHAISSRCHRAEGRAEPVSMHIKGAT